MKRWAWVIVVMALVLVGCGQRSCVEQEPAFTKTLQGLLQEWQDASTLAGTTPRVSLAPQVATLQGIRRKVQALEPPACGKDARDSLVIAMDAGIDAYTAFLGQSSDADIKSKFETAGLTMNAASQAIAKLTVAPK